MPRPDLRRVAALAYDGLGTFELGIVVEVFGLPRPEMGPRWYRFQVCALEAGPLRATGGLTVEPRAAVANEVARRLVVPPLREGGQAQFAVRPVPPDESTGLARVLQWAQAHLDEAIAVDNLAQRAGMSGRTFARTFKQQTGTTPHRW